METLVVVDDPSSSSSAPPDDESSSILVFALGIVCLRCVCFLTSAIVSSVRFLMVWNEIFRLHQPVQLDIVTKAYEPKSPPAAAAAAGRSHVPEETCPICLVPYRESNLFEIVLSQKTANSYPSDPTEEGDIITHGTTCCQHKFHTDCLSRWLKTETSCPCCRGIMVGRKYSDDESVLDLETVPSWYGVLDYLRFSMSMVGFS